MHAAWPTAAAPHRNSWHHCSTVPTRYNSDGLRTNCLVMTCLVGTQDAGDRPPSSAVRAREQTGACRAMAGKVPVGVFLCIYVKETTDINYGRGEDGVHGAASSLWALLTRIWRPEDQSHTQHALPTTAGSTHLHPDGTCRITDKPCVPLGFPSRGFGTTPRHAEPRCNGAILLLGLVRVASTR